MGVQTIAGYTSAGEAREILTDSAGGLAPAHQGGEEQVDSKFNSQIRVQHDSKATIVALTADATVYDGPCRLNGIYVNAATATGATVIEDGAGGDVITLPTGLAAGTYIPLPGVRFENALFVDAGGGGSVTLFWREAKFTE